MQDEDASLATMRRGEVIQRFDIALAELAADILDPDKEAKAKRKITLTLTVTPNERRDTCIAEIEVKTTLPPPKPESTLLYVAQRLGRAKLAEHDARQPSMFEHEMTLEKGT
jgi:hypothetical protein